MPVMEGKAVLFKEFGGVDALPICLATKDVDEIIATVKASRPASAGSTSRTSRRRAASRSRTRLRDDARHPGLPRRPARHRGRRARRADQRAPPRRQADSRTCGSCSPGVGAAGVAVTKILLAAGVARHRRLRPAGRGPPRPRRTCTPAKAAFAAATNPRRRARHAPRRDGRAPTSSSACRGPAPSRRTASRAMAAGAIVFAMANPTPEVDPGGDRRRGRRDRPPAAPTTPTRSTTCSPSPASSAAPSTSAPTTITEGMKLAAAEALAAIVGRTSSRRTTSSRRLQSRVAPAVAGAVAAAAERDGVARRERETPAVS